MKALKLLERVPFQLFFMVKQYNETYNQLLTGTLISHTLNIPKSEWSYKCSTCRYGLNVFTIMETFPHILQANCYHVMTEQSLEVS